MQEVGFELAAASTGCGPCGEDAPGIRRARWECDVLTSLHAVDLVAHYWDSVA